MGGDDFNKSNTNGRNTGKSIDELKRIVNEKRDSESTDRAEQVYAMFERILEIGDIENKIINAIDYNLDKKNTEKGNITINLSLPFIWTGVPERTLNIWKPLERYGGPVQFRLLNPRGWPKEQGAWFTGSNSSFQIERFSINQRLKHYNDISLRLQEYFKGTKHLLVEGSEAYPKPTHSSKPMSKPVLKLTVSW